MKPIVNETDRQARLEDVCDSSGLKVILGPGAVDSPVTMVLLETWSSMGRSDFVYRHTPFPRRAASIPGSPSSYTRHSSVSPEVAGCFQKHVRIGLMVLRILARHDRLKPIHDFHLLELMMD